MDNKSLRGKRKKQRQMKQMTIACAVVIIVIAAGVYTTKFTQSLDGERGQIKQVSKNLKADEVQELSLVMVGDNLLHMPLIRNAERSKNEYNFDSLYEKMNPYFQSADIAVIVQETVLGGNDLKYSGYPLFNSPQEVGDSMVKAGFDVILHATNHVLDKGEKGIQNSIDFWKKYPDVKVLGINETNDVYNTIPYIEKNGIKLAVLNYTDSTNGMPLPSGKEYMVNVLDKEKMIKDLTEAEKNADFTAVFMHWGTEYSLSANEGQTELAKIMCENGADLIMGSHPHVIEPVEWISSENGNKALVFYSLGNYVSRQKEATTLLGLMGGVKICKSKAQGAYIDSASVMPTVTHYNTSSRGFYVYPLKDYTDELASVHGVAKYDGKVSVERFRKTFESVFKDNTDVSLIY